MPKPNDLLTKLIKENDIYLNKIIDLINFKSLEQNKIKRNKVLYELLLIQQTNNSEEVYKAIRIALFCKEHKEPYILKGGYTSLYIFYLLGLSHFISKKVNTYNFVLFGTKKEPRKVSHIEVLVRKTFIRKLLRFIIGLNINTRTPYFAENEESEGEINLCLRFLKKEMDPRKYFEFKNDDTYRKITNIKVRNKEIPDITINIGSSKLLKESYKNFRKYKKLQVNRALKHIYEKLVNKEIERFKDVDISNSIKQLSLENLISIFSMSLANYEGTIDPKYFVDRETLFRYLSKELRLKKDEALELTKNITFGLFNSGIADSKLLSKDILDLAKKCIYLPMRCYSAELAYWYLVKYENI